MEEAWPEYSRHVNKTEFTSMTGEDWGVTSGEGEALEESWDLASIRWESIGGKLAKRLSW